MQILPRDAHTSGGFVPVVFHHAILHFLVLNLVHPVFVKYSAPELY